MEEAFEAKHQAQLKEFSKLYYEEKQDLLADMKILEMQAQDNGNADEKYKTKIFFLKWTFLSQLRKLKLMNHCEAHAEACQIER